MPTIDELAEHILKVASDPARLRVEAAKAADTPFTIAQAGCVSIDEKLVLFSRCFGLDAMPAYIRVNRWDVASLKKAAAALDLAGQGDLAAVVRETLPTIKLKVSTAISAKREQQRRSRRAYLKALAKARRAWRTVRKWVQVRTVR